MDKTTFIKLQLQEMETCFWKSIAIKYLKPKEIEKYEDALNKEKDKLVASFT